jgi:hypothetical protein
VVWAEEASWEPLIRGQAAGGGVSEVDFMEALQRRMEGCVLGMASGSYAQRVQVRRVCVCACVGGGGGGGREGVCWAWRPAATRNERR